MTHVLRAIFLVLPISMVNGCSSETPEQAEQRLREDARDPDGYQEYRRRYGHAHPDRIDEAERF